MWATPGTWEHTGWPGDITGDSSCAQIYTVSAPLSEAALATRQTLPCTLLQEAPIPPGSSLPFGSYGPGRDDIVTCLWGPQAIGHCIWSADGCVTIGKLRRTSGFPLQTLLKGSCLPGAWSCRSTVTRSLPKLTGEWSQEGTSNQPVRVLDPAILEAVPRIFKFSVI